MRHRWIVSLFLTMALGGVANAESPMIFSFEKPNSAEPWQTVNDGVMGGRSVGKFRINDDGNMLFFGTLSLENNGGFASVRAVASSVELKEDDAIVARVKGDGRVYNFNLYARRDLGGYSYRQSFTTREGEWIEVELSVDKFVATYRGRVFPEVELNPSRVTGLGILLGDKQPGPFELEVDWIKVKSAEE